MPVTERKHDLALGPAFSLVKRALEQARLDLAVVLLLGLVTQCELRPQLPPL